MKLTYSHTATGMREMAIQDNQDESSNVAPIQRNQPIQAVTPSLDRNRSSLHDRESTPEDIHGVSGSAEAHTSNTEANNQYTSSHARSSTISPYDDNRSNSPSKSTSIGYGCVKFSPSVPNLYGCINTKHSQLDSIMEPSLSYRQSKHPIERALRSIPQRLNANEVYNVIVGPSIDQSPFPSFSRGPGRKHRSTLLELRTLYTLKDATSRRRLKRFGSTLVGYSQGILGSSAYSTCLSFRPPAFASNSNNNLETTQTEANLQIATGLSSGALCVHTGTVNMPVQSNDEDQAPNSVVQLDLNYYSTRHTKQATSVAWRPRDTKYVALGLQSQRHKSRAEEFCCLVWDIEHQSGSGGSSIGGGSIGAVSEKREPSIKGKL